MRLAGRGGISVAGVLPPGREPCRPPEPDTLPRPARKTLGDIEGTAVVITARGVAAAERFVGRVYDAFDLLAGSPNLGHRRTDLTPLPVVFRKAEPPQIVRVVAWRRDVGRLLKGEVGAARP